MIGTAEVSYGYKEEPNVKTKRPGMLIKWFSKKLLEGIEYEQRRKREEDMQVGSKSLSISREHSSEIQNQEKSIRFTVHVASGGRIVETQKYDRQKDRHQSGLYVITNDQDFGKEIEKIITMEALK